MAHTILYFYRRRLNNSTHFAKTIGAVCIEAPHAPLEDSLPFVFFCSTQRLGSFRDVFFCCTLSLHYSPSYFCVCLPLNQGTHDRQARRCACLVPSQTWLLKTVGIARLGKAFALHWTLRRESISDFASDEDSEPRACLTKMIMYLCGF